jgi:hypothetical protein
MRQGAQDILYLAHLCATGVSPTLGVKPTYQVKPSQEPVPLSWNLKQVCSSSVTSASTKQSNHPSHLP